MLVIKFLKHVTTVPVFVFSIFFFSVCSVFQFFFSAARLCGIGYSHVGPQISEAFHNCSSFRPHRVRNLRITLPACNSLFPHLLSMDVAGICLFLLYSVDGRSSTRLPACVYKYVVDDPSGSSWRFRFQCVRGLGRNYRANRLCVYDRVEPNHHDESPDCYHFERV